MIRAIRPTSCGASPSEGSSSSSSRGSDISARPMASICCSPPESSPARCPARSASTGNSSWTRSRASARGRPPSGPRAHRPAGSPRRSSGRRPAGPRAPRPPRRAPPAPGPAGRSGAVEDDLAGGDRTPVQPQRAGDRAQQRGLAGAVAAEHGQHAVSRQRRGARPPGRGPTARTAPTTRAHSARARSPSPESRWGRPPDHRFSGRSGTWCCDHTTQAPPGGDVPEDPPVRAGRPRSPSRWPRPGCGRPSLCSAACR